MYSGVNIEERLEGIINMLIEFSRGNFDIREEVTDGDDPLNTVVSGLNMLGEELFYFKKELSKQNDFLKNILSSIDEIIYARKVFHEKPSLSPFTFISARTKEIIGYSPEELVASPSKWIDAIHPDDVKLSMDVIHSILKGEEALFCYRVYNPIKKEYRWLEDKVVPEMDSNGVVVHLYGSARDITQQQETTIELEDKNKLIQRLISSSDQFFYIVELDFENTFVNNFTYLSWQIEKIQGSTKGDISNNPFGWLEAIHPDDIAQIKNDNLRMFSSKAPVTRVYRVKHAITGEYIWLEDYVVPVADDNGRIKELYGAARDITGRKTAALQQEKLITELNNRNNELMQFNYIVSHNLRAPVSHLLGLSRLLSTDISEEERKQTVEYMQEAAETMDELLHDMNAILSARSSLNEKIETFLLTDVINLIGNALRKEINDTKTIIHKEVSPDANEVTSIKSYIQSALFNLVSNAIKYRAQERQLIVDISVKREEGKIVITVADNGSGIDLSKHREKIFGLYSKLHTHYEGKGLGLYMTKTQIESLGGAIDVKSKLGVGTTFSITL